MYLLGMGNRIQYGMAHNVAAIAGVIYDIMFNINNDTMFSNASDLIGNSVRSLIGVFMLFRIVVSLLNYLVNPDAATDKSTGGGKLLTRMVIVISLLLLSNLFIFDELKDLQNAIVKPDKTGESAPIYSIFGLTDNKIEKNEDMVICSNEKNQKNCIYSCAYTQGADFSYTIFTPFLDYSDETSEQQDSIALRQSFYNSNKCDTKDFKELKASAKDQEDKAKTDLRTAAKKEKFDVDFITSLLMSLISIVMTAIMCIDVVVRNLKILVLEAISPVTICCYINPKDKIFNTWLRNYGSVYADLFVKLIALRLMSILISYVNNVSVGINAFEKLFYIMGIIVFAKALPGFISKIFGIEGAGSFKESAGMLKKGLGFGAGAAAGLVAGGVSRAKAAYQGVRNRNDNNGKGRALGAALVSSVSGAFSGATRGAGAGFSGGGKGVRNAVNSQIANNNRLGNQMSQGSTFLGRTRSAILSPFGLDKVGLAEVKKQKLEEQNKSYGSAVELKSKQEEIVKSSVNGQDIQNAAKMGYINAEDVKRGTKNIYNTDMAEHSARTKIANEMKKDGKSQKDIDDFFDSDEGKEIVKAYERSELAQNLLIKGSSEGKIKTDIKQRFVDEAIAKLSDEAKRGKVVTVEDYTNASKMAELDADTYMKSETGRNEIEMRKNSGEMSVFSRVYNENLKVKEAVDAGRKKYREEFEKSAEYNKLSDDEKQKVISQKEIELQREIINSTEYKTVFDETIREAQTIRGKNGEIVTKITRDSGDVKKLETNASQFQIKLQNSSDMGDVVVSADIEDAVSDIFTYDNMKTVSNTFTDARNSNDLEITRITTDPKYVKAQVDKAANEENKGK